MRLLTCRALLGLLAALVVGLAVPTALLAKDDGYAAAEVKPSDSTDSTSSDSSQPKPSDTKGSDEDKQHDQGDDEDQQGEQDEDGDDNGSDSATAPAPAADNPGDAPAPAEQPPAITAPDAPPAPPVPALGKSVVLAPSAGTITVRVPGSNGFHALAAGDALPVGTVVDSRHGRLTLSAALDANGAAQTATFWGGVFAVRQAANGVTELDVRGPRPTCPAAHSTRSVASAARIRWSAGLWGHDNHGKFRTRGSNSVATVRGTTWFVQERCAGTYTRVTKGAVAVRDTVRHRTVVVHAGHSYLARHR
jgi:hypothetical protein